MARGNKIIVSSNPKGTFEEGVISGALYPGTLMQVKPATKMQSGRFTFQALAPGTDGIPRGICILREDTLQGKTINDAYADGTRCFLYWPIPGEEFNVRTGEVAGTGNTYAIGDLLIADAEDGILVPNSGTVYSIPFQVLETVTQQAGSSLVWCKFLGT